MKKLHFNGKINRRGPLVLVVMDGVGLGPESEGNAFARSNSPVLRSLMEKCTTLSLRAHGTAVGLPSDADMGNSEVGHNALGAGRVFDQGAMLVNRAIENDSLFSGERWGRIIAGPSSGKGTLHFIGLLSDGNVHSHIDHLFQLLRRAAADGARRVRVHVLLDGRDVPETSALTYVDKLEQFLAEFGAKGLDYRIASGGGRMVTTMDRYEADWEIVKRGWEAHVLATARPFVSAREAIETFRKEQPGIIDQYLPSFTVTDTQGPVGPVLDGDSVVLFNFRGDRAIELSRAFEEKDFTMFERVRFPDVAFAGMMEYDGDLHIPANYLVTPPAIDETVSEYLALAGVRQYAVSETQKFGHVTYFWNGNRSGKFNEELETYEEIPSDRVQFDQRPWMKAAEITDSMIRAIRSGEYRFLRLNYPNGDMVGHTGNLNAAIVAVETVDLSLVRLLKAVDEAGGIALLTADHGNLEEMLEINADGSIKRDKKTGKPAPKTAHTLNPVPFIIYDPEFRNDYRVNTNAHAPGLANVAATLLMFLGYDAPEEYLPPLILPV
ncbi:MAG: 2,3-bisphosphoglycerate-independent phosphoglycerate mutase [Spirochaetes bacterium]|nr:MAG: 2,3-bisphosphoglycerate-independent phosphoglycerate mutase [Spirochaetota bacterium]